jgi:hypothetical protein
MRLQTVPGGAESPESVRQRSNLAELLAYAQGQQRKSASLFDLLVSARYRRGVLALPDRKSTEEFDQLARRIRSLSVMTARPRRRW